MELNYKLLEQIINIDSPTGYCNKVSGKRIRI